MRDIVLQYLKDLGLRNYTIGNELPFDPNGTQLHIKNPKKIYVDVEQYEKEPFIQVFNGNDINLETTTVVVYFANDAKQLPQEYSSVVNSIKLASQIDSGDKYFRRVSDVSTEYVQDLLVTKVELKYSKLITS